VNAVRMRGPTVVASITAHHIWLTTDDVVGNGHNFCKPVAKDLSSRVALVQAVMDKSGKFSFGK
jgi:dihydroorotase